MKIIKIICLLCFVQTVFSMKRKLNDEKGFFLFGASQIMPNDLAELLIARYVMKIPVLEKQHTEENILDFVTAAANFFSNYSKNVDGIALCKWTSWSWYNLVRKHRKKLSKSYQNMIMKTHMSPVTTVSYALRHDLCNKDTHMAEMYNSHRVLLEYLIEDFKKTTPGIRHLFLDGWSDNFNNGQLIKTFACFFIFSSHNTTDRGVDEGARFLLWFFLSGEEQNFLDNTSRNNNGDFTFEKFFSILKIESDNREKMKKVTFIPSAPPFMHELCEKIGSMKEGCVKYHEKGEYPDVILTNEPNGTIKGAVWRPNGGSEVEIVGVTIKLREASIKLLDVIFQ